MAKKPVWMTWYGGSGYGHQQIEDAEPMESISAAVDLFEDRLYNRAYPETPCVDKRTSVAWLYLGDPRNTNDLLPDYLVYVGPRGGIKTDKI